uniref:Thioredoxin-like protein 1 n=1 Tax=Panagrolaimus sp. JU765 TaxID=591449 RepID=A0AC34Q057_9BILA
MVYLPCKDDSEFQHALTTHMSKVIIVDFYAEWCRPCQVLAPFVKDLAERKPNVVFLTVDIDECKSAAIHNGVKSVPTFAVFVLGQKKETISGPSKESLEAFVNKAVTQYAMIDNAEQSPISGQVDLTPFIDRTQAECLNEEDKHTLKSLLEGPGKIVSDCDEQLIINLPFHRPVKIHSIKIKGPAKQAPKKVKIFANVVGTLDFDKAQNSEPIQTLDFDEAEIINLRFVKFQNVKNIQLFVENNKGGGEQTVIDEIKLYGQPVEQSTNMSEFTRVAGKPGEVGH